MDGTGEQWTSAIRTPDQRVRVFVSSTLVELAAERDSARAAIEQLRLAPVMFESGARPHPAQAVYRAYLAQSDVFIGIYGDSYGWVGPGMSISGLEDELQRAGALPRLLYVKASGADREQALRQMLDNVKADDQLSYKRFDNATQLRELILTDLATLLAERFGTAVPAPVRRTVPPSQVTQLVGRDADIDEIVSRLQDHRLVVLTGAGGVGKTRLALAVLQRSAQRCRDGAAFVDLSTVTDAHIVPAAIASALGLVVQGRERPRDALRRHLAGRELLVVLDNVEQVATAVAPVVAELLEQAPQLRVLATSRVVLRVRGELEWRVDALALPPANGRFEELAQAPALQLFVDRIRDVQPGFALTPQNAGLLAEVCRRLSGLPLALELAAGWMRLLNPEQMADQLYQRMEQPGPIADLPDRQQSLTSTISWSYDRLPASAQDLLARLSVFAGPFTVDAVIAVCATGDADVVDDLSTLVDSSLVGPGDRVDGQRGFQLLDPIRRFAAARLTDQDLTLERLQHYIVNVLSDANTRLGSHDQLMRRLDSEEQNLRAVLAWIDHSAQNPGLLLQAVGDAWPWMLACGHLRETSELWQQIRSVSRGQPGSARDRLSVQWLEANRRLNDGAFAEAVTLIDAMLPDARRVESAARRAVLVATRAIALPPEARDEARANFEEALAIARYTDDPLALAYVLSHDGLRLCVDGDAGRAQERHQETLDIGGTLDDENLLAEAEYGLALDSLILDDTEAAQSHLAIAIDRYHDFDHLDGLTRCIGALAALTLHRGDSQQAARLIGTAAAGRDRIGLTPWPAVAELEARTTDTVAASMQADEFTTLVESGRNTGITEALAITRS